MGLSDWRRLLGDPDLHWKRGRSAVETAVSWELAVRTDRGLPPEICKTLDGEPTLAASRLLVAFPEHKVKLKGRGNPSQTDVWALLRGPQGLISMAVEAKAGEPFAATLSEWMGEKADGKRERLSSLCEILQIASDPPTHLRYQLFHRTASAILEAERFGATAAIMMVQSFRTDPQAWDDYVKFATLLGATVTKGAACRTACTGPIQIFLGWTDCAPATDEEVARAI